MASAGANCFLASEHKSKLMVPNPKTERGAASSINFHPKENKIIYAAGKFIVVRNLDDPSDCFVYRGHAFPTTVAKFSPNGFWVASADSSGKVKIWSWDNPQHLLKVEVPVFSGPIQDLDWDHESKKIVAVGEGGQFLAKCFTWDTGNSAGEMVGHNKRILSCSYRKARPFKIMTGGEDFGTVFYNGPPFKMDHSNNVHSNFVNCVRYSPDGNFIVSVGADRKIQLYDGTTGQPTLDVVDAHAGAIYSVTWKPDSTKFLTASADKTLKLWNAASLTCEKTFEVSADPQVGDMQVSVLWTESNIISVSLNGNINIFIESATLPSRTIESHQSGVTALCVDPITNQVYTGSSEGVVCVRNPDNGETFKVKSEDKKNITGGAHGNKVTGIVLIDNNLMASVGWDDSIRFADITSKAYIGSSALVGQPSGIASSSIPGFFAVVSNTEIALYRGREKVGALGKLSYTPMCTALCGDKEIAIGGDDSKTHIYSITTNGTFTEVTTIETRSPVTALSYSPNADVLAIGDNGRQVEVYERGSWTAKIQGRWVFHTSKITTLAWSPTGTHLASGSLDESVFIWDLSAPSKKIQFQFAHMGGVTTLGWLSPKKLITAGNDLCTVVWNVPIE